MNTIKNLNIILDKAIASNNEKLMNNTIKLRNKLLSKPVPKIDNQESTYIKTPDWLRIHTCTINPENNKKLSNKSFNYTIAKSKTIGKNRSRLSNINKYIDDFNFDNINYPLTLKDYEQFENQNESIKLTIFKTTNKEKELIIYYNNEKTNDREIKMDLILLENNHYIYLTKVKSILKYIVNY